MKTLRNAGVAMFAGTALTLITTIYFIASFLSNYELTDLMSKEKILRMLTEIYPLPLYLLHSALSIVIVIFSYAGFIYLGKKFKQKQLLISAWVILLATITSALVLGGIAYQVVYLSSQNRALLLYQTLTTTLFLVVSVVSYILLGLALEKLKDVELSKITGRLYVISGATLIIMIGNLLLLLTQIFAGLMFLKASKKFE
ncbi:hypothetical protein D6817_02190 [Candidatus Pacearchaeota archaeon]|nr:MAG: hypothetical protein D6817_02190 [Candidatus Pacearchaeota archaeon]